MIAGLTVLAPTGERIPLSRLADIREVRGPKLISGEWGKRRITIQCNVRGRDVGSFVAEAQRAIDRWVQLPPGFRIQRPRRAPDRSAAGSPGLWVGGRGPFMLTA